MTKESEKSAFIPANEKKWFIRLWRVYVYVLFRRRFTHVFVRTEIEMNGEKPVLFFCNHFYWWDALIPFFLCEFVFPMRPRAVMEDKQMRKFPFFAWIGAFSVNRDERRGILTTLRYAADWLTKPGRCLFIFPNGTFTSPLQPVPPFEPGLRWIAEQTDDTLIVPMAFFIDHTTGDKPDLYIFGGKNIEKPSTDNRGIWLETAQSELNASLLQTQNNKQDWKKIF